MPPPPPPPPPSSTFLGTGVVIGVQQRVVVHERAGRLAAQHVGESSRLHPAAVSPLTSAVSPLTATVPPLTSPSLTSAEAGTGSRCPSVSPLSTCSNSPHGLKDYNCVHTLYAFLLPSLCPLATTVRTALRITAVSTLSMPSFSSVHLQQQSARL